MQLRIAAALATVYLLWGSTYLAIAYAVGTLPPLAMSALRFAISGAILFVWTARRGSLPTRRQWLAASVVGIALLGVGTGGIAWAEQRVPTGTAALVVATVPLWMALLDRIFTGARLAPRKALGLVVGLAGVALLVGPSGTGDLVGVAVVLVGSLSWAAGSLYARGAPTTREPLQGAAVQMLAASAALTLGAAVSGDFARVDVGAVSATSLGAVAYLVVFGSLVGYTAYAWLVRSAPITLVSTYAYVNPAVAVFLGWEFRGEPLGVRTLVAALAIIVSVALTVTRIRPRRRPIAAAYDNGLCVAAANGRAGMSSW